MSTHVGDNYWLIVGPLVVIVAIAFWLFLVVSIHGHAQN